jgi:hypothetical protein
MQVSGQLRTPTPFNTRWRLKGPQKRSGRYGEEKQEVLGRTNSLLPFDRHGPNRKLKKLRWGTDSNVIS